MTFSAQQRTRPVTGLSVGHTATWRLTLGALIAVLLAFSARPAAADTISPDLQAALHLKILSFDRALADRLSGSKLVIAVLYNADSSASKDAAEKVGRAFRGLGGSKRVTVHGKSVSAVVLPMSDNLRSELRDAGAMAIYVGPGLEDRLSAIVSVAESASVPTLSGERRYVQRGIAVGVVPKRGKPKIVVNLKAAKAAGMALDAKLVRLADLVR